MHLLFDALQLLLSLSLLIPLTACSLALLRLHVVALPYTTSSHYIAYQDVMLFLT